MVFRKKVNLTGAVSQINAETIENRPINNLTQAIQGVVPNLNVQFGDGQPGKVGTFNVRGSNPIGGGSPLVVIDGIPGTMDLVNPRDVESISVLRDAASSAIYGARGATGVILITTKKGKKGEPSITYSNNFGFSSPTVSTDFNTSGYDVAQFYDEAFKRSGGAGYTGYSDADMAELLKRKTDPSLPSVVIQNRNGKDQYVYYGNTDWWHYFFNDTQVGMEHSVNVSGGSDKIDYYLSGRFNEKDGMMRVPYSDKFKSYNLRAKINAEVKPWLSLYSNIQFNTSTYTYPGFGGNENFSSASSHALPSYVPVNPDGTAAYSTNLNNYNIASVFPDLLHGKSKGADSKYDLITTFGATGKITKDWNIVGNYTYNLSPSNSFARRTQIPWSVFPGQISYVGTDQLTENVNLDRDQVINLYTDFAKNFGNHHAKVTAGYNQELKQFKTVKGTRNNLISEDLNALDLGTGDQQLGGTGSEWAVMGVFYRLNYDYDNKYLLELNGRYDGTSRFPSDSRFGFFPSVSAGWRMSEESFFSPLKNVFNELKLRGSYGSLGNQQVSTYAYIPVLNSGTLNYLTNGGKTQYLTAPDPISPSLTWETITSKNIGVDFGLFNNRLYGTFDWYTRDTKDMLTKGKTLPEVLGAPEPRENAANLRTKGFELSVNWQDGGKIGGKPFSYNIGFILSDYQNTITKFDNPSKILSDYYVGQHPGEIWGYSIGGLFQSDQEAMDYKVDQSAVNQKILTSPGEWGRTRAGDMKFTDLNGDNIINKGKNTLEDHGDLRIIGNKEPRFPFGVNGGARFANFDMSFIVQGIGKQNWYPGSESDKFWGPFSRAYISFLPKDFISKVSTLEDPNRYFPINRSYDALSAGRSLYENNDRYLQDLAYIRLKNLTLGYTVPSSLLKKVGLTRCRVYFSGENMFTLTKMDTKYIDPETASANNDGRGYPLSKMYSFGLDLSF